MNTPHKDINKIVPFGEFLRGFINQRYITVSDLLNVLRERGVFVFDHEKDVVVPVMQNLLLSPSEFDKVRYSFSEKKDFRDARMYIFLPKSTVGSAESRFFSKKGLSGGMKAFFSEKSPVSRDEN